MIELQNVSFAYENAGVRKARQEEDDPAGRDPGKDGLVLRNISLTIAEGEAVGLIGANGAGKSTLMKVLLGLVEAQGRVLVDGLAVEKKNLPQIRHLLGFVMQDSDNQMFMPTVYEDMLFGPLNYGLSRQEAGQKVDAALGRLGLEGLKHRHNHRLSGGEKRMAAIATILAMEPAALLMDEPTSALDPYNRRIVINTIRAIPQTRLITSHDLDMIMDTCTRVILLSDGEVAADGPADLILRDRVLLEAHRLELPLCLQGAGRDREGQRRT